LAGIWGANEDEAIAALLHDAIEEDQGRKPRAEVAAALEYGDRKLLMVVLMLRQYSAALAGTQKKHTSRHPIFNASSSSY